MVLSFFSIPVWNPFSRFSAVWSSFSGCGWPSWKRERESGVVELTLPLNFLKEVLQGDCPHCFNQAGQWRLPEA